MLSVAYSIMTRIRNVHFSTGPYLLFQIAQSFEAFGTWGLALLITYLLLLYFSISLTFFSVHVCRRRETPTHWIHCLPKVISKILLKFLVFYPLHYSAAQLLRAGGVQGLMQVTFSEGLSQSVAMVSEQRWGLFQVTFKQSLTNTNVKLSLKYIKRSGRINNRGGRLFFLKNHYKISTLKCKPKYI